MMKSSVDTDTKYQLVQKIINGGNEAEAAFAEVYNCYQKVVGQETLRILKRYQLAEEATQNTFIKFKRSVTKYDPTKGSLEVYLKLIAYTEAKNIFRREYRYSNLEETFSAENIDEGKEATEKLEFTKKIELGLAALPKIKREVLIEHYVSGKTLEEIGAELGIPIGTIKSHLYRAREFLKRYIS